MSKRNFVSTTPCGAKTETDVWITPKWIMDALGIFDLDPCGWLVDGTPIVETALRYFTERDDGLSQVWVGSVFCNFPYSQSRVWMEKMSRHANGVVLCFARTETKAFQENVKNATGIVFINKRVSFVRSDGTVGSNGNAPSILIAWGEDNFDRIKRVPGISCRLEVTHV